MTWWLSAGASADCLQRTSIVRPPTAARILILDNHDDFGGHAKRNEFKVRKSDAAELRRYSVDREPILLQRRRQGSADRNLGSTRRSSTRHTIKGFTNLSNSGPELSSIARLSDRIGWSRARGPFHGLSSSAKTPLSEIARRDIAKVYSEKTDYLPRSFARTKARAVGQSQLCRLSDANRQTACRVLPFFQSRTHDLWCGGH